MDITFDDIESMQSFATLNFSADSPVKTLMVTLKSAPHSMNAADLIAASGLDPESIKLALGQMYKAGIIYTEQNDHYALTDYGQKMLEHVSSNPEAETYNFSLNTEALRSFLSQFQAGNLEGSDLQRVLSTPAEAKVLQTLIARGYVVQSSPELYTLTPLGQSYTHEFINGRHLIGKGMPLEQVQKAIPEDLIVEVYERFKKEHPEYANVYDKWEHTLGFHKALAEDVRNFLATGSPITNPPWSKQGYEELQKLFGTKNMPYISSIEDAISRELYYSQIIITATPKDEAKRSQASAFGHVFTMEEIKSARSFVAGLQQMPESKVNAIISKLPAGTIISSDDVMKIAEKLMRTKYPKVQYEGPNQNAIEKIEKENFFPQISQAITSKIDPSYSVIFPNDTPERMASIVSQVLKSSNIELYNNIEGSAEIPDKTLNDAVNIMLQKGKNFNGLQWSGIKFDKHSVSGANFGATDFSTGDVSDTVFDNCDLSSTKFVRTDIGNTSFEHCNLTDTDFAGAINVDKAKFIECTGRAKNLPKIYKTDINKSEIGESGRITGIMKNSPETNRQNFYDAKLNRFELALAPKLLAIMKGKQASIFRNKPKPLRFQVFSAITDEQKNELLEFSKGGSPPSWLTKDVLVQLNRSGELSSMGIANKMGYMMSVISPKVEKPKVVQQSPEELENEKINEVTERFRQSYVSGQPPSALSTIFAGSEFADINKIFQKSKTEQEVVAKLQEYLKTHDVSQQVTNFRNKERLFSYESRFTDIGAQDRTGMSGYYQDKMFAVLLSPKENGIQDPDVRKLVKTVQTADTMSPHWKNAIASARIEPHVFTTNENGEIKTKRVWIIVELQADPQQKASDSGLHLIESSIGNDFPDSIGYNSLEEEVVKEIVDKGRVSMMSLRPVAEKLLRQQLSMMENFRVVSKRGRPGEETYFKRAKKIAEGKLSPVGRAVQVEIESKHTATFEELIPVAYTTLIDTLVNKGVAARQGSDLVPTPVAPRMLHAYHAVESFRSTFKRWPEAIILDTINRAIQVGGVDEIWVASAADFSQSMQEAGTPWNLNDVYDRAAEKFTGKEPLFYPRITIEGSASTIYFNAPHKGSGGAYMGYHVIDLNKWKSGATASLRSFSSLRFVASAYTNFIDQYMDTMLSKFPFLDVLPREALIESAAALMTVQYALSQERASTLIGEISQHYHVQVTAPFAGYANIIVSFSKVMDQRVSNMVNRTGESPKRILQDFATGLAEKYMPETKRHNFEQLLNDVVDAHMEDLLPESIRTHHEHEQLGVNPDTGGNQPVGPAGEEMPPEEKAPEVGEELPPVQFEKPSPREFENLKQEELDRLLDRYNAATDPVDKEQLRKKLQEWTTLSSLKFSALVAEAVIVHEDGKWKVKTHDKKRTLGEHASEESAKRQLRAIEMNKHKHGSLEGLVFANYDFGGSPRNDPNQVSNKNMPTKEPVKKMVKTKDELPPENIIIPDLKFSAVDEEFTRRKDEPFETGRNDWFQYEPAHGEGSPVLGGPGGSGDANDTANMDFKGGFFTDLNLPDQDQKKKQLVTFEPERVNLQLWTSLKFADEAPSQNPRVIEKGSGKKGAIVGPGSMADTVLVMWDGATAPVEVRKLYLANDVDRGAFDTSPGSTMKPKDRPRQQDVNYRRGMLEFGFIDFKQRVMPFIRKISKYADMDDSKLTEVLYNEYKLARKKKLL